MTRAEKYETIQEMESIGEWTKGTIPTRTAFYRALAENRVAGDYSKVIRIASNDANRSYTLIATDPFSD